MRITIVNRYFVPEPVLVNDIARWLAEAGHDVQVICSQPSYNPEANVERQPRRQSVDGVEVRRLTLLPERNRGWARYVNGLLFIVRAAIAVLFGPKTDVVWSTSIPPVLQPFLLRLASAVRSAKFVYFVQDIYPEIAVTMRMVKPGWFTRSVSAVDQWTVTHSDRVVVLSDDMVDTLRQRSGAEAVSFSKVNNFAMVQNASLDAPLQDGPCRFVFAGNMGRFQNLERLVSLFSKIDPNKAVLEFLGEGRMKAALQEQVTRLGIKNVRFHPIVSPREAATFIGRCNVGVVSLTEGLFRYAYPSKTFAYLSAGVPILALVESGSQIAKELREREIGVHIDWSMPEDEQIARLEELCATQERLRPMVRERAMDMFDRDRARDRWLAVFASLQHEAAAGELPAT